MRENRIVRMSERFWKEELYSDTTQGDNTIPENRWSMQNTQTAHDHARQIYYRTGLLNS